MTTQDLGRLRNNKQFSMQLALAIQAAPWWHMFVQPQDAAEPVLSAD